MTCRLNMTASKNVAWICMILMLGISQPRTCRSRETLVSRLPNEASEYSPNSDILKAVAHRLNVDLEFAPAPFKRALLMMKTGDMDIMAGILMTPERKKYITYILPPYKTRSDTVFFVPPGKADLIRTYEDLYPLKIGATIGAKYFPKFDRDTLLSKEIVPNIELSVRKLLVGRIDTVISSEGAGIDFIDKQGLAAQIELARFRFTQEKHVYIGISKASRLRERLPGIETVIGEMIRSGEILKVFKNYYIRRNLPVPAMN